MRSTRPGSWAATVDSILAQRGNFELEHLVYDAGSTDGSVELLRGYGDRLRLTVEPDRGLPLLPAQINVIHW